MRKRERKRRERDVIKTFGKLLDWTSNITLHLNYTHYTQMRKKLLEMPISQYL